MLIDTHVHIEPDLPREDVDAMLDRARSAGVGRIVVVGGSEQLNHTAGETAQRHPDYASAAVGFDREHAGEGPGSSGHDQLAENVRDRIGRLRQQGVHVCAVGEIGIDLYYHPDALAAQTALLRVQLELARALELPVVIHSREADEQMVSELGRHRDAWTGPQDQLGVLHCFTGGPDFAQAIAELGYYVSFSGITTFRNADSIRDAATHVPADRILVETDTPYLAPVPHRGRTNEPAYVVHVADVLATARGTTPNELATLTTANARRLFDLP